MTRSVEDNDAAGEIDRWRRRAGRGNDSWLPLPVVAGIAGHEHGGLLGASGVPGHDRSISRVPGDVDEGPVDGNRERPPAGTDRGQQLVAHPARAAARTRSWVRRRPPGRGGGRTPRRRWRLRPPTPPRRPDRAAAAGTAAPPRRRASGRRSGPPRRSRRSRWPPSRGRCCRPSRRASAARRSTSRPCSRPGRRLSRPGPVRRRRRGGSSAAMVKAWVASR